MCMDNCEECQNGTACGKCDSGFYLHDGGCVSKCPNGTFEEESTCVDCTFPCKTCDQADECKTCEDGYNLDGI